MHRACRWNIFVLLARLQGAVAQRPISGHTAHYKELTETGNRESKVSGIQVSDCLTA